MDDDSRKLLVKQISLPQKIFEHILTKENVGRESEAPAEPFRAATTPTTACERCAVVHEGSAGAFFEVALFGFS